MNPSKTVRIISVLLACPMSTYLQEGLARRFNLIKFWEIPRSSKAAFLKQHSESIRAVVGNGVHGADAALIDSLPNLEIIASHSSGLDKIDLARCKERGIRVSYAPGISSDEVADLAILLAIATLRRISEADRFLRSGMWKKCEFKLTSKFSGKSVGLVGLGRIGLAVAKRAEAFGCPISYHSRSKKHKSGYNYYPNVIDLAFNSDVLIVCCALTSETHHIINREAIDALGPTGVLINVARGPLIDEPELVSALLEGRLAGAGLDVLENEPEVPEQLAGLDSVVLSPHVGAGTVETRKSLADLVIANLEKLERGKRMHSELMKSELLRSWTKSLNINRSTIAASTNHPHFLELQAF